MSEPLRRWLDDEVELGELPPRARSRAQRWKSLFRDLRARAPDEAPAGLEDGVMARVREHGRSPAREGPGAEEDDGRFRAALGWLLRPRQVPVPPAAGLAAAALVLFLVLEPGGEPAPAGPPAAADATRLYAEFVLEAPDAESVAVAGTFTDWSPSIQLRDPDGNGVWSARVPLEPGRHEYMFVVNGERWVTDPDARRYVSDGFGHRNAVLAVAGPSPGTDG